MRSCRTCRGYGDSGGRMVSLTWNVSGVGVWTIWQSMEQLFDTSKELSKEESHGRSEQAVKQERYAHNTAIAMPRPVSNH